MHCNICKFVQVISKNADWDVAVWVAMYSCTYPWQFCRNSVMQLLNKNSKDKGTQWAAPTGDVVEKFTFSLYFSGRSLGKVHFQFILQWPLTIVQGV